MCETKGFYIEYKKLSKFKKADLVKHECPFQLGGYWFSVGDWSFKVRHGKHNHEMVVMLRGYKIVGRLKSNKNRLIRELINSMVLLRNIIILKNRNSRTATNIKHVYNACDKKRLSTTGSRSHMRGNMCINIGSMLF
jgi:hypothetical protein